VAWVTRQEPAAKMRRPQWPHSHTAGVFTPVSRTFRVAEPSTIPKYVSEALLQHFYLELAQGHKPIEMLEGPVNFGFSAKGLPPMQESIPVEPVHLHRVAAGAICRRIA